MELYTGQHISSWVLEKRLGVGGEGEVWSALTPHNQLRALKFSSHIDTLRREYDTIRSLMIQGIVTAHSFQSFENFACIELEFIEGIPMVQYLKGFPPDERYHECVHLLISISNILSQLHQRGLMHLDIKSDNLLVTANGMITIIDFGKTGIIGEHDTYTKGTHTTMSPEQRVGQPLTKQSDVYSLAVTVFQALLDTPPPYTQIGSSWPSLLNCSPEVEQCFDGLLQQCLHIVPTLRPAMLELHNAFCEIQTNSHRANYYRISRDYIGELPILLNRSIVLTGLVGSGRKRIIRENVRLAYLEGVQSVLATASPSKPFGLWKQILLAILSPLTTDTRQRLLQSAAPDLAWIIPEFLPIQSTSPFEWDLEKISQSILQILYNTGPIAVILLDIEQADPSSLAIAKRLFTANTSKVCLWCTSTNDVDWAPCEKPPKWRAAQEQDLFAQLLPIGSTPPNTPPARTPLQSSIKVWHWIASKRSEPCLHRNVSTSVVAALSLLNEPFPRILAEQLIGPTLEELSNAGVLEPWGQPDDTLSFSFLPFKWMLKQSIYYRDEFQTHQLNVLKAWQIQPPSKERRIGLLEHSLLARHLVQQYIVHSLRHALHELNREEIFRLWMLSKEHSVIQNSWTLRAVRAYIQIEFYELSIARLIQELDADASSAVEKAILGYLRLSEYILNTDYNSATQLAEQLLLTTHDYPHITLSTYREVAWIYLKVQQFETSIKVSQHALNLGLNQTVPKMALSLHLTLSAAFLASGHPTKAFQVCQAGLQFSEKYEIQDYYLAALHTNAGLALFQEGNRVQSKQRWITIRQLPDFTQHLSIRLHCLLASLRLSIEEGNAKKHVPALKSIVILLQKQHQSKLLEEATALMLECAVQTANKRLAQQAFELAESSNISPFFLTTKARWLWLTGYLEQAWSLLNNQPDTFDGFTAQAEQIRLGVVLGKLEWAKQQSAHLLTNPRFQECKDLCLFVTLCQECIYYQSPTNFLEHGVQNTWTEIELGSLHLLALRTHFQGKSIDSILQILKERSTQLNHRLYLALSDPALYAIQ